jgi:hypothetical protein
MSDTAASFDDVTLFGGRGFAVGDVRGLLRRVLGSAAMGVAAVAAVGACAATVAVTGLWMVGATLSDRPHIQTRKSAGPARLALADPVAFPKSSFEARWAATTGVMAVSARAATAKVTEVGRADSLLEAASLPDIKAELEVVPAPPRVGPEARKPAATARIAPIPLPRPKPLLSKIAQAPMETPAPRIASVAAAPVLEKRESRPAPPVLSGSLSRTALYDITGSVVYMPNGERLEAHSGFGHRRDNPRFINVRNLGPTPPNVYKLTLRERLFHGVRAVRMTPVDENAMFGRDGMLAHSYMLGESGQSNGCVSFKDYERFLQAFLKGQVDRIVVVRNLDEAPQQLASLARADGDDGSRYATNEITGSTW